MPAQIPFTIMCNILIIQDKYDGRPEAGYLLKGEKNAYWNFSPVIDYCFSFFLLILIPKRAGLFGSDWWPATSSAESEAAVLFTTYQWGKPQP